MRRYGGGRAFLLAYRQFDRSSVESIIEKRFQDLAAEGLEAEALALVIATGKQLHAPTRTNEWRAARWGVSHPAYEVTSDALGDTSVTHRSCLQLVPFPFSGDLISRPMAYMA